jgi:hypothetical protein
MHGQQPLAPANCRRVLNLCDEAAVCCGCKNHCRSPVELPPLPDPRSGVLRAPYQFDPPPHAKLMFTMIILQQEVSCRSVDD